MAEYSSARSDERIKRLMEQVGYPNSLSVYQAFKQLEMEVRLECSQIAQAIDSKRGNEAMIADAIMASDLPPVGDSRSQSR